MPKFADILINSISYALPLMRRSVAKQALNVILRGTRTNARSTTENHSGRDKQVPAVKDCRFTQTAFGTVVHDSSGKWLGQYETEDAAVEMLREMARDNGGYDDEI